MSVSVEILGGLERRMSFGLDTAQVYTAVRERLGNLARHIKLDGFRAGKAPLSVVEQRLGPEVRQEVIGELITTAFYEAAAQEQLRPAGTPDIQWSAAPEAGDALAFTATFEVYPEFELAAPESLKVERPVVDITEADVDQTMTLLRQQELRWEAVDRPAETGDRVMVDMRGYMDDEPLREIRGVPFVLGAPAQGGAFGRLVQDEFARQIAGVRRDEVVDLEIGFPDDYESAHLAGQQVRFTLTARAVEVPVWPELDDAFAARHGVTEGGMAALRGQLLETMRHEANAASRSLVKQRALAALLAANPVELPKKRVATEAERLRTKLRERMLADGFKDEDVEIAAYMLEDKAREHISLGLILARLVRDHGLAIPPEDLERVVAELAAGSPNPKETADWYRQHPEFLAELESSLLEEQVVDWLLHRAQVVDTAMSFGRLMSLVMPEQAR